MKKSYIRIIELSLFLLVFIASKSYSQKYYQIKNTPELRHSVIIANEYLKNSYSDEIYVKTGIFASGSYNNLIIISGAYLHVIDLNELFEGIYNSLKSQPIDYKKIRYIIIENFKDENGMLNGDAIFITGEDFTKNIDDFESIKSSSVYLENTYKYKSDKYTDITKILKSGKRSAIINRDWGTNNRDKR